MTSPITVEGAAKRFPNGVEVFDGLDLVVRAGECLCVVGPSGCGKTTLLRAIDGLVPLDRGRVTIGGTEVREPRRDVAMVFQHFGLFPWKTVEQNIGFGLEMAGLDRAEVLERVARQVEMVGLRRTIEKVAPLDVTVLLLGESGTGKELLAHAIHALSPRAKSPFIPLSCAAIPETLLESELFGHERGAFTGAVKQVIGKVEAANKGTLFLDEIGDVPQPMQVKLLRFLQDQIIERVGGRRPIQVDVRVVCATHQNLTQLIADGRFREDLFYRINEVGVQVPPLRDRMGDATLLAKYFLNRWAPEYGRPARSRKVMMTSMSAGCFREK